MKKQILIVTFFVLALLAGVNMSYGQSTFTPVIADGTPTTYINVLSSAPGCAPVQVLTHCAATLDELHPQSGQNYTYSVTTSNRETDPDQVHWFVIANQTNLITALNNITGLAAAGIVDPGDGTGGYILNTESTVYNLPTQTDKSIDISWKWFDGASNVVLLVAYVVDGEDCTDNIEVYRIMPEFNFTLSINGINEADGSVTTTPSECVSPIESATYAAGATPGAGNLTVDYGENWLFFSVTAANFTHSWMPRFQTTYTGSVGDDGITVEWAYPDDALANTNWHATAPIGNTTTAASEYTSTDPVLHSGTNLTASPVTIGADDGTGECIVVRVRVDHGTTNENADANKTLTLAVDGTMYNSVLKDYTTAALKDLHDDGTTCVEDGFTNDRQDYILSPRPEITTNTTPSEGDMPFENKTGN